MSNRRSRRDFLKTTAAAGSLAILSPDEVFALLQNGIFVRPNVKTLTHNSPDIIALKAGINAMRALPASNPLNWNTFANIHGAPSGTGPLWNTCQHGHWWFLPWHRMYLLFFERIIRKLSNQPTFAMPFWDYTSSATPGNTYPARALPAIMRSPTTNNALFITQRGAGINAGQQLPVSATSHQTAFTFANFTGPTGSSTSFGSQQLAAPNHSAQPHGRLESQPHDAVHGSIGGFMGSFSTAARDPIFWMHHANIDRLWNLWLTLGGGRTDPNNSTWCNRTFSFFNENGTQVNMRVRDVINSVAQLKVRYQGEPTIPTQTCPPLTVGPAVIRAIEIGPRTLMTAEQPTTLAAGPTRLSMRLPGEAVRGRARSAITDPARTLVLRVEGIKVDAQPGVIYEVYVGLPAGQKPEPASPHFVGTLSTFGAEHAGGEGMTAAWPIDAAAARALQGNPNDVQVTFVPRGLFVGNAEQPVRLQGRVSFRRMRVIEE